MNNRLLLTLLVGVFLLSQCKNDKKIVEASNIPTEKKWDRSIPGSFSDQTELVLDSARLDSFIAHHPLLKPYIKEVSQFYRKRKFAYAWFEKGKLIEPAQNLSNRVLNLKNDGIYQAVPYGKQLDSLLNTVASAQKKASPELELMLTAQYFVFAKMVWHGMDESVSKASKWYVPREKMTYGDYLDSLLKKPTEQLSRNAPVYRQYELLRNYLKEYNDLEQQGEWQPIVSSGNLKSGDSSKVVAQLKRRLFLLGDLAGDTTSQAFNADLAAAVKIFQTRHGLTVTGIVNKPTLAELNVPLEHRIHQIVVNMERSRWVPVSIKGDYLAVNIPEYKLHVYHNDTLQWNCNVVVGQTVHQTTVFYGQVQNIVFSPYWNVPPGILKNEVIPGMKRNANYLANHNMEITGYEGGLPVVRQKPGPQNSLGFVKFLFPNSYNIYLHDTPSRSLFGETSRAFSHGCIRVGEPTKLAQWLLRNRPEWTPGKIDKAMHSGKEQYLTLKPRVPVFIAYFTAFVDRDSKLNFRKDIYQLDDRLADMVISGKGKY